MTSLAVLFYLAEIYYQSLKPNYKVQSEDRSLSGCQQQSSPRTRTAPSLFGRGPTAGRQGTGGEHSPAHRPSVSLAVVGQSPPQTEPRMPWASALGLSSTSFHMVPLIPCSPAMGKTSSNATWATCNRTLTRFSFWRSFCKSGLRLGYTTTVSSGLSSKARLHNIDYTSPVTFLNLTIRTYFLSWSRENTERVTFLNVYIKIQAIQYLYMSSWEGWCLHKYT